MLTQVIKNNPLYYVYVYMCNNKIIIKSLFIFDAIKAMLVKLSRIHIPFIQHAYTSNKTNKTVSKISCDIKTDDAVK